MLAINIKIGDVLTSKSESSKFRTKGRRYKIQVVDRYYFKIIDDTNKLHRFDLINAHNYWKEIEDTNVKQQLNTDEDWGQVGHKNHLDALYTNAKMPEAYKFVLYDCSKSESLKFILSLIKA